MDLDQLPADSVDEQVDTQLEAKLEKIQVETDKLLVDIAELRRTCPESIRSRFALDVEDLERAMPGVTAVLVPETDTIHTDIDEQTVARLVESLERLKEMNHSIPELVAKLKRAQQLCSQPVSSLGPTNVAMPASNSPNTENINEMLHKQRRINRQHDLAAKLLAQQ